MLSLKHRPSREHIELTTPLMASTPAASSDPFYVYQDELKGKMSAMESMFSRWDNLLKSFASTSSTEIENLTIVLDRDIKSAEGSLSFLEQTLQMVDTRRTQFPHIDDTELQKRRKFVAEFRKELNGMQKMMDKNNHQILKTNLKQKEMNIKKENNPQVQEWRKSNDNFIQSEQQRQQTLVREQDEDLEHLGQSVQQLGHVALVIHNEIDTQNKMLDELNVEVEETHEKMHFVMSKMEKLLQTKDKCQLGGIFILTIILVVMVFLVIYV